MKVRSKMFTDKQIDFMKSIGLNFDFSKLSENEYFKIEDQVGEWLQLHGIDETSEGVNEVGRMCMSVLNALP